VGIPAAISAIAGLLINALFQISSGYPGGWIKPLIALAAAVFTAPLVMALFKNRLFQIDRNNWRVALFLALQKKTHPAEEVKKLRSAPEEPHPDMVIFSTPHLSLKAEHEPLYWN
jgi:hypothetical protein